jgi:hypothetical protein
VLRPNHVRPATPEEYLDREPTHQVARPAASSWGEEGYWRVWLNEKNQWIYPHLQAAQERLTELARCFAQPAPLAERALRQAARELLLAQASDWPFILRTGTSPDYARQRVKDHLLRFNAVYDQLTRDRVNEPWLRQIESRDKIFPDVNFRYWGEEGRWSVECLLLVLPSSHPGFELLFATVDGFGVDEDFAVADVFDVFGVDEAFVDPTVNGPAGDLEAAAKL